MLTKILTLVLFGVDVLLPGVDKLTSIAPFQLTNIPPYIAFATDHLIFLILSSTLNSNCCLLVQWCQVANEPTLIFTQWNKRLEEPSLNY